MNEQLEGFKNLCLQIAPVGGWIGTIAGALSTFIYRRRSTRQHQELIDLQASRGKQRVELTHVTFQEFRGLKPPLLQVRIVVRNHSDRQEVIRSIFLENDRDGTSQVHFAGQHELGAQGVLEMSAERVLPAALPTEFEIHLIDGTIRGSLKAETTSHGVFPVFTPDQIRALACGDFDNPAHPLHGQKA